MIVNNLKLNQDKTETLIVQTRNIFEFWSVDTIALDERGSVSPSSVVGVHFDKYLTFDNYIQSMIQGCYIQLRNLRAIVSKLSFELKKTVNPLFGILKT